MTELYRQNTWKKKNNSIGMSAFILIHIIHIYFFIYIMVPLQWTKNYMTSIKKWTTFD